jgi:hypothetical protein
MVTQHLHSLELRLLSLQLCKNIYMKIINKKENAILI